MIKENIISLAKEKGFISTIQLAWYDDNKEIAELYWLFWLTECQKWLRDVQLIDVLILPQSQSALDPLPLYFFAIESYRDDKWEELYNTTNENTLMHYISYEEALQSGIEESLRLL